MNDQCSPEKIIQKAASKETCKLDKAVDDEKINLTKSLPEHELELRRQEIKELEETHKLRLGYANKIFWPCLFFKKGKFSYSLPPDQYFAPYKNKENSKGFF